jgi:hypothetical protein
VRQSAVPTHDVRTTGVADAAGKIE